ncbi:MAG TPA: hypothetical protein VK853_04780, partial [Ilumatobacteraceae bacterium]|nr:hypothetical protein [Ilumatobacteraceae bacterium]
MQHGARRRTSIVTRPGSLAIAFAIVVGSALVVGSPARAETTWEPDDAAQVVAVSVTETGERKGVTVSWPAPTTGDYDGFQLRRNGIVVASVDAATLAATDDAPVAGPSSYTVVATRSGAIDGQLQPATVRFPWFAPAGVVLECNLLWTGSASQSWHDERNWAPFGVVGSEGVPRPPGTSDRVCVDHQAKLPIEVTEPNANALAFTGTQPGPATLRMVDGDLTLTQPSIIPAIELLGGRLDLKAATRLVDVDRPVLVLGGGHLVIGERVFGAPSFTSPVVAGGVEVLAGTTSILDGGRLDAVSLDLDHTSSSSIEGRNGHLASIADQVTVNGGATLTTGTGGATLWTSNLTARDGTNRVEWELAGLSASSTIDVNVEAGETRLTDLLELVDDGTPEGKELWDFRTNIAGTLVIDEQIERIGFVELRGNGQLRPGGTSDNLGGIIEANSLALDATPPILLDRDFRAAQIRLDGGSELTVSGALESYMAFEMNSAELRDGRLTVGAGWSTDGSSAVDIVGAPGKPFVVDGDVRFEGSVRTSYFELPGEEENNSPAYGATFTGDVAFGLDSAWSLSVTRNPDDQPEVTVQGNLAVAGTLVVRVPPGVPETFQRRLVAATNRDLDPIETVIDGPDDVRIEERPDGIWAVRGESTAPGSWGPGASPRVASITVDGAGVPTAVTVQWPDPVTDFEGFQLRRDDVVVPVALGPDARTAVDPSPTPGPAVYAVVGLIDGLPGPAISSMPVVFPADPTCNLVWSGAVSSEWGVADNWTPIGLAGSEGAVRVPSAGDHACVPQSDPTLISVTEAAAVADRVTGPRAEIDLRGRGLTARDVAVESVALRSASLTVEEPIVIPPSGRLVVEDGAIVSGSIEVAGTLAVGLERDQQFVDVAVSGDLRLRDGSRTEVNALVVGGEEPEFAPSVAVGGELALAGSLLVDVPVELLDPSLETLFSADPGSVTGAFDTIELTGEIDGVFIEVVSDGVLLRRGDGAPGEWGPGVVPQVRALTIGGGGTPSSATFTWPDPVKPFVYFELRRNGEWAASGGQTVRQLTDSSPVAGPAVYTVVGINLDGSESSIATAPVVFPSDVSCSIVWVGSVGDRWSDVRNWAPMGVASLGGAVRVPLVSDHVCVPQRARVFVADVPAVAGRVSGPDAELSVADAGLTVGDVTVRSLEVAGGTVSTGALTVNEISVVLGGRLGAGAVSLVGDGPRVSVTDGEVGSSATIVVTDGQVLLDGRSTVTASLELAGTSILSVGGGDVAASIGFERDLVLSADGSVVFSVDPARPPVVFVEGVATLAGVLVVDVVEGLPDPFEWPLIVAESPPLLGGFSEVELTGVVEGVRVELLPAAVGLVRGSPQWAVGDAVQVESLVVDAAGVPVSVGLSWPEMSLVPSGFDVVRVVDGADEVIGSVGGGVTSFVDVDPVADARYRVDAVSGGVKVASLGDPRVVFPSDVSCSIVWTGSSGDEWSDVRNWAPMGVATLGGAVRVPSVSDHVCIPQGSAVALMDASVVVGRVSGAGANLSVFDAEFVAGNVSLSRLAASSATVSAGVVVVDSVVLRDGSGLFVESIEFSGSSVSLSRLEMVDSEIGSLEPIVLPVGVTAFFDGSVEVSGSLDIANGLLVGLLAGTSVAISGGLVVRPTATVLFRADFGGAGGGAGPTSVVAQGDVQLGGALRVELVSELADSFEFALVRSGSLLTGEFASTTFIGESAGASVAQRTDGIYLLGPAGACAAAPDANGVDVSGCWIDNGDDTYTHTDDLVESPADEPALGGIELDPQPGTELTLDLTDPATPVLSADGPVQVTFEIRPPSGPSENWTVIEPSMSWSLGGAGNPLTTGTFLGLPGVPVLANDAGTLRIRAVGFLPAPFDGAAFTVEVPVSGGAITAPAASAPGVSIGGVLEPTDMTLGHRSGSRWNVGSAGPGVRLDADLTFLPDGRIGTGTIDLRGTDLAGLADADTVFTFDPASRTWNGDLGDGRSVRFTEGTGGRLGNGSFIDLGSIDLGFFQVDGPIRITRTGGGTWQLPSRPGLSDIVQGIELRFDRGRLDVGQLRFGDLDPLIDNIPTLGDVAGWLPLGGFDAGYDAVRDVWFVNAWLDEPDIAVRGEVGFEDGALATGALAIEGVPLGSLALLDLDLAVTGPGTFELDASLVGAAFEGARSGSGSLTFDDGELVGATVEFQQLPIGDLFVIDDFTFAYDSSTATTWEVNGRVSSPTDGGAPALVEGSLEFTDGVLTGAMLELRDVGFGPSTIDLLSFELDRTTASGPRESTYRVAGAVRGPRPVGGGADIPAPLEPITGSATILDGRLTGFSVTVPSLEIPGFAYLRDLAVSYQQTGTTAVLAGNGAVRTATSGSAFTAGSFQALIDDGRVDQLLISATRLDLAGLLAVETFQAAYNRSAPIGNCSGLDSGDPATIYSLSGTVGGSALAGCIALAGRSLVGALLTVDQLEIADLLTIQNFRAEYASSAGYPVAQVDDEGKDVGPVTLRRTALDVGGRVTVGGTPVQIDGFLELTDGGVSQFDLAVDSIPLSATVALTDVEINYQAGARFSATATRAYAISANAVHDQGTTSATGSLVFRPDGRVQSAGLQITELPLGPVTLEQLTFAYVRTVSETEWLAGARLTAPDDPNVVVDVTGQARFERGRLTFAQLDVPALSVGELIMVTDLQLGFERFANGSERWSGTGGVAGLGQATDPATATVRLDIGADGRFTSGLINVGHVRWGGLFHLTDLTLSGSRNASTGLGVWSVNGRMSIGGGATSQVSGSLRLRDGRVVAGSLSVSNLGIAGVVAIQNLVVTAQTADGNTVWTVAGAASVGGGGRVDMGGEFEWRRGRLDRGLLTLGNVPIGELFRIDGFRLEYDAGERWAAAGTIVDEDGTSTLGGELLFTDGVVSGGLLDVANLQLGPLDLVSGKLRFDSTGRAGSAVCGVSDSSGPGTRYSLEATIRAGDGTTTSAAGRLRIDGGRVTEGVVCASGVKFADFLVLDDFNVRLAETTGPAGTTTTFSGAATASTPGNPPVSASVDFAVRARQLQTLDIEVGGIVFGDLLTLRNASLTYDRAATGTNYALAAVVAQPGGDATFAGSLGITDGIITSGSLTLSQLRFGD